MSGRFLLILCEKIRVMFTVLFITFSGIALGYAVRKMAWVKYLSKSITYTIWLLLFFFGLQVGANEQVISNLYTLGLRALAIAVAGSLGSCIAAGAVYKFFFSNGGLPCSGPQSDSLLQHHEPSGEICAESVSVEKESGMNMAQFIGGFIVVAFFALGCVCGWLGFIPTLLTDGDFSMYVLYLLMVQVGISIGSDKKLKEILRSLSPKLLLLPLGTIVGTLLAVAGTSVFLSGIRLQDTLAVGAGFGYYSLSSVLITQIKEVHIGVTAAAQLGTIALMTNIMREVITLLFAPVILKVFGKLAPISVGGATSMDSTLPVITAVCGKEMVFISIFHGVLVDFSVPFLVTFFASL